MGILSWMFGDRKLWEIGDHRVREKEVVVRGSAPHGVRDSVAGRRKIRYRCVDCHKEFFERDEFEDEPCYEVID